ncbi:hypothetical protein CYMTET_36499 [Cymbomonas tetramitiformis]|uniref:DUF4218 domain-containing protein n=1 Tax=Cymbomonas tetramitiformis TaxID=36881 RepID=A0AAE0F765_9CHLO|nr:hypothetical protein CYMTET_36499 [Cymbomonas tetramitiformis]
MPFCPCVQCNGERWLSSKQTLRHVRANGLYGDRSPSPERQQDEHSEEEEFPEDVAIHEAADATIKKINRLFLGPQEDPSAEESLENVQASADVVANNFVLDLLVSHNHHNSSQAYFDAILNILRVHYVDKVADSAHTHIAEVPSTYAQVLQKWKEMFKGYNEVDVCPECSEFFQDEHANRDKCPKCLEPRYEDGKTVKGVYIPGRARCIFRWWPLETLFTVFFLTPELAMLARTWWKEGMLDKDPRAEVHGILDSPGFLNFVRNKWDVFKDPRNIAIMACADGVQSFNDGIRTVTPLCFTIVNFPGEIRCKREYVMTWGIWDGKPKVSSKFYDMFTLEVNRLTIGVRMFDVITNTVFTFKLVLYKVLEDYVGLSDAARRLGANSYLGCLRCWIRGESIPLRTNSEVRETQQLHAKMIREGRVPKSIIEEFMKQSGVKEPCPMSIIPDFDVVKDYLLDLMHILYNLIHGVHCVIFDKPSPWGLSPIAKTGAIKWVRSLKLPTNMGPLPKKLLQEKYNSPNKVRKMKAAELVVSLTSGILGVIASWQNADGQVLRPQYAKFVGEFAVVVRELTAPSIDPEEMNKLQSRVMKLRDEMERNNSPEALVIMSHLLVHIVDQLKDNGPAREIWMYVFEDYFGLLKLSIKTRSQPVASMMKGLELRRTVSMVAGIKQMHRIGRAPHYRPPAKQNIFTTKSSTVRGHPLIQPFTEEEQAFALAGIAPWTEYPSIKIGREDFRVHDSDIGLKSCQRYFKSIFRTPGVPTQAQLLTGEIPDDDVEDRYGEIMKIVKLDLPGHEIFLLKARWYPKAAALADDISKNIYLRKDMPWDVSQPFVRANSIENQVVIQDVPFMPAWLARFKGNAVPMAIRRRTDCLQVVLDRKADFFRELDGNSSSEDDSSSSSDSDDCG